MKIDVSNIKKEVLLKALYDGSHVQGLGFLQAVDKFTVEDAKLWIECNPRMYADYVFGRVIKVDLSKDELEPDLYDRDCGDSAAQRQIDKIMKGEYGDDVFINM